ncbi:MAG TPA: hypothetical protein VGM27_20700 [Acidobacteriaceae bacterium]
MSRGAGVIQLPVLRIGFAIPSIDFPTPEKLMLAAWQPPTWVDTELATAFWSNSSGGT